MNAGIVFLVIPVKTGTRVPGENRDEYGNNTDFMNRLLANS